MKQISESALARKRIFQFQIEYLYVNDNVSKKEQNEWEKRKYNAVD